MSRRCSTGLLGRSDGVLVARRACDGVNATPHRRGAVDAAAREPVSRRRRSRAGENTIPYNEEFRLFLTAKMPNPHYSPEVQVKISLVNFTVTQSGLEEQLLGATVCISVRQLLFTWMGVGERPFTLSSLLAE